MGEARGSDELDVRLEWPDGAGGPATAPPAAVDDPGLPDGRVRVRVGDGSTVAQLRDEVAALRDEVLALRREVAALRDRDASG